MVDIGEISCVIVIRYPLPGCCLITGGDVIGYLKNLSLHTMYLQLSPYIYNYHHVFTIITMYLHNYHKCIGRVNNF